VNSLQEIYQSKTDDELINLCVEVDQLTPEAREALKAEMGQRGLTAEAAEQIRAERDFKEKIEQKRATIRQLGRSRTYYGRSNRIILPRTKRERFTTTIFRSYLKFPLVPIGTYRVERMRSRWRTNLIVLEKLPLNWAQVLRVWVAATGSVLILIWILKLWLMFRN
jgi:hypothetical protein